MEGVAGPDQIRPAAYAVAHNARHAELHRLVHHEAPRLGVERWKHQYVGDGIDVSEFFLLLKAERIARTTALPQASKPLCMSDRPGSAAILRIRLADSGSWDHGIMVTLKASENRSRSLRRHAIPQVRPSRSVGRERERRASTGVCRITSAAPCVRMACPSANARGWSLGGQNPNLRTGVIHGGKSPPLISFPIRSIEKENKL